MIFVRTVISLLLGLSAVANAGSCLEKTTAVGRFSAAVKFCDTQIAAKIIDKKCLDKCVLDRLGVVAHGEIQYTPLLEIFRNESTSEVYNKLEITINKCKNEAGQGQSCNEHTAFLNCLGDEDSKLTC